MGYDELVRLYFERSSALQWYWNIYVIVIGGLLAYSTLRQQRNFLKTILVTILYCCFAYKNLDAIHDVTLQRYAILQSIQESKPSDPNSDGLAQLRSRLEPTLTAATPDYEGLLGVRNFHVFCDVLTIAALWVMEYRRKEAP
jgi:hypothetical protein